MSNWLCDRAPITINVNIQESKNDTNNKISWQSVLWFSIIIILLGPFFGLIERWKFDLKDGGNLGAIRYVSFIEVIILGILGVTPFVTQAVDQLSIEQWITLGISLLIGLVVAFKIKEPKNKKKGFEEIREQLDMYTDIDSDRTGWLPGDVGPGNLKYLRYQEYLDRFTSYVEKVDPEIKDSYRYVVEKFKSGIPKEERQKVRKEYHRIREYAKKKSRELGDELSK